MTILGVPDQPGTSLAIFSKIAAKAISVDMIVQNVGADGIADISFTVLKDDLRSTLEAAEAAARELKAEGVGHDDSVAKVSVVGLGMARQTGVARRMFRALADAKVNILMISTSEIKISVLVAQMKLRWPCVRYTKALSLTGRLRPRKGLSRRRRPSPHSEPVTPWQ